MLRQLYGDASHFDLVECGWSGGFFLIPLLPLPIRGPHLEFLSFRPRPEYDKFYDFDMFIVERFGCGRMTTY